MVCDLDALMSMVSINSTSYKGSGLIVKVRGNLIIVSINSTSYKGSGLYRLYNTGTDV